MVRACLQLRHQARGHGGRAQQQGLQPDDHVEAPGAHRLPGQQGAADEGRGARPAHPAVLEPAAAAAGRRHRRAQRQGIRQDGDRRQRRGMPQAERQERPEALRREIAQGHHGGQHEADHQHDAEPLYHVAEASGEWRREQAYGRAGAQHEPQLRRGHPARVDQGREKGRRDAEGRVHRGIQQEESGQRSRPDGSEVHGMLALRHSARQMRVANKQLGLYAHQLGKTLSRRETNPGESNTLSVLPPA